MSRMDGLGPGDARRSGRGRSSRRTLPWVIAAACLVVVLALAGGVWWVTAGPGRPNAADPTPSVSVTPSSPPTNTRPSPTVTTTPTPMPTFNMTQFSLSDPTSPWVIVNKTHALNPIDYAPADLVYPDVSYVNRQPMRQEVATALVTMFQAGGSEAGLHFSVQSAYRSFDVQTQVYNDDASAHGKAFADTDTARPGYSEHQTGMAVDISSVPASCSLDACFGTTAAGQWLVANAWRFGFLLRYPADKVNVTGFTYEPWHFRYIGVALSTEMHNRGVTTLEEFFGVSGGQYPA